MAWVDMVCWGCGVQQLDRVGLCDACMRFGQPKDGQVERVAFGKKAAMNRCPECAEPAHAAAVALADEVIADPYMCYWPSLPAYRKAREAASQRQPDEAELLADDIFRYGDAGSANLTLPAWNKEQFVPRLRGALERVRRKLGP